MKLIIDNYKEIQAVKKMLDAQCNKTVQMAQKEFKERRIPIFKQIDAYLLEIASQLKGSTPRNRDSWVMESHPYRINNDNYPARTVVTFNNGDYTLKVTKFSGYSSQEGFMCTIKNGVFVINTDHEHIKKQGDIYEDIIIQTWKELKASIHTTIAKDFEEVQLDMNKKLSKEQARQEMYDTFEI